MLTYTVTAADDGGASDAHSVTVTISGTNDAPSGIDDDAQVNENATLSGTVPGVLANDVDIDAGAMRGVSQVNGIASNVGAALAGTYGTLTLHADGSYTYVADQADALAAGVTATDTFHYTVSDGASADTAELAIAVIGLNDAPVAAASAKLAAIGVNSGAHLIAQSALLANATDVDGPALTAKSLQIARGAGTLVDNNDGTWTYTPKINDDTQVDFSFGVTDGLAAPVAASAALDIVPSQASPAIGSPGDDEYTAVTGNSQYDAGLGIDTMIFDFELTDATVNFDGNKVVIDGPTSHTVLSGFERFVFADGTVNNADADLLVETCSTIRAITTSGRRASMPTRTSMTSAGARAARRMPHRC